jgi:cyanate permease
VAVAVVNLGIIVGPPLFGALVDATGSYAPAWTAMAVGSMLTAICFVLVREASLGRAARLAAGRSSAD